MKNSLSRSRESIAGKNEKLTVTQSRSHPRRNREAIRGAVAKPSEALSRSHPRRSRGSSVSHRSLAGLSRIRAFAKPSEAQPRIAGLPSVSHRSLIGLSSASHRSLASLSSVSRASAHPRLREAIRGAAEDRRSPIGLSPVSRRTILRIREAFNKITPSAASWAGC